MWYPQLIIDYWYQLSQGYISAVIRQLKPITLGWQCISIYFVIDNFSCRYLQSLNFVLSRATYTRSHDFVIARFGDFIWKRPVAKAFYGRQSSRRLRLFFWVVTQLIVRLVVPSYWIERRSILRPVQVLSIIGLYHCEKTNPPITKRPMGWRHIELCQTSFAWRLQPSMCCVNDSCITRVWVQSAWWLLVAWRLLGTKTSATIMRT